MHLLLDVAQAMAEEVDGVSEKENEALARVRTALDEVDAASPARLGPGSHRPAIATPMTPLAGDFLTRRDASWVLRRCARRGHVLAVVADEGLAPSVAR